MMPINSLTNDASFQALKLSMDAAAMRHQAIASNLANVNTPNYKRMDLSTTFSAEFDKAMDSLKGGNSISSMPKAEIAEDTKAQAVRFDGNSVNFDQEMVEMMKNQSNYEFAAKTLAQQYSQIRSAISGKF
jgi:flagellar basal-body rod protein FlgB